MGPVGTPLNPELNVAKDQDGPHTKIFHLIIGEWLGHKRYKY